MTLRWSHLVVFLIQLLIVQNATAFWSFTEMGFGYHRTNNGSGPSLNVGAFLIPFDRRFVQVQVGAMGRGMMDSGSNLIYPLGVLRLQFFERFYFGAGGTKWTIASDSGGNYALSQLGAFGTTFQVGILWIIIPDFHWNLEYSYHVASPVPRGWEITGQMRFLFGTPTKYKKSYKWDGWRYPYGIWRGWSDFF